MPASSPHIRSEAENHWATLQPFLQAQGYQLRPRYHPRWVPSWSRTMTDHREHEDSVESIHRDMLDAVHMRTGNQVVVKKLASPTASREESNEYAILRYFSTKNEAANHVVPCYDAFRIPNVPNTLFVTMPVLTRHDFPLFYSLEEVQDFLQQVFEGVMFMHAHNVAHGNIRGANIMMDSRPLYDEPFHPVNQLRSLDYRRSIVPTRRRSQVRVRYYLTGLEQAVSFRNLSPSAPRLVAGYHQASPAPERRLGRQYDPFLADVYCLGKVVKEDLMERIRDLHFIAPIVQQMMVDNPTKRLSIQQALQLINAKFGELWALQRRRPIRPSNPFMLPHDGRSIFRFW